MTQHWWMHWFWITTLHTAAILTTTDAVPTPDASLRAPTPLTLSQGQEQPPLRTPVSIGTEPRVPLTFPYPALSDSDDTDPSPVDTPMTLVVPVRPKQLPEAQANTTEPTVAKVTKKPDVKYKLFVNRTVETNKPVIKTTKTTTVKSSVSTDNDPDDATTTSEAPLIDTTSDDDLVEEFSTDSGDFKPSLATILAASESRVTRGEVMLGRASEYPRSELDPAVIAGICLGVVGIVTLSSAIGFVFYRRRYLNKPQTLSDKCSNPDSTGYIDDSTIRENSEEMYSLDNDSFLNSLEAMTIQNYWTDSVKHTKL